MDLYIDRASEVPREFLKGLVVATLSASLCSGSIRKWGEAGLTVTFNKNAAAAVAVRRHPTWRFAPRTA